MTKLFLGSCVNGSIFSCLYCSLGLSFQIKLWLQLRFKINCNKEIGKAIKNIGNGQIKSVKFVT